LKFGRDAPDQRLISAQAKLQESNIARGDNALARVREHAWAPPGFSEHLCGEVNDGLILSLAPELRRGELDVALPMLGDTFRERQQTSGELGTRYAPSAAADAVDLEVDVKARDCATWESDSASWEPSPTFPPRTVLRIRARRLGHSLPAVMLAATLNLGNLASVSRPVKRDVLVTLRAGQG